MTKAQFLYALDSKLSVLSDKDKESSIEYYSELIDDRMEEGLSESEAIASLGSVDEIYNSIIAEIPLLTLIKRNLTSTKSAKVWTAILSVFGFLIIGLPLLLSAFAVVISLYAALWSVVISLFATTLALLCGGVGGVALFFFTIFIGTPLKAVFILGIAIFSLGLVFPFYKLSLLSARLATWASKKTVIGMKKIIAK